MLFETEPVQFRRENQDPLPDFLDRLWNLVERRGEGLDVFALERGDEGFAKLFGQFLRDSFVFPATGDEFLEALRRFVMLESAEKIHEMMNAAVSLLRAGFEQVEKLFV